VIYAGNLVWVAGLDSGYDVADAVNAGVERGASFGALVNLALPSVHRPDGREVVDAGTESLGYELSCQFQ
jgi:hypothetical protein